VGPGVMYDDMTDGERLEAAHRGGHEDPAHGIAALNGELDPSQWAELADEIEQGLPLHLVAGLAPEDLAEMEARARLPFWRGALAGQSRVMAYCFADEWPSQPEWATCRLYAIAREFFPSMLEGVPAETLGEVFTPERKPAPVVFRGYMALDALLDFSAEAEDYAPGDERSVYREGAVEGVRRVLRWLLDAPEEPIKATRRLYITAKAYYQHLINRMSLRRLAQVFEESERGARARWGWRCRNTVNDYIEARTGRPVQLHFQKGSEARAKYAAAARKTCNRREKNR